MCHFSSLDPASLFFFFILIFYFYFLNLKIFLLCQQINRMKTTKKRKQIMKQAFSLVFVSYFTYDFTNHKLETNTCNNIENCVVYSFELVVVGHSLSSSWKTFFLFPSAERKDFSLKKCVCTMYYANNPYMCLDRDEEQAKDHS